LQGPRGLHLAQVRQVWAGSLALDESIGAALSVNKCGYRPKFRAIVMADLEGGNDGRDSYEHIYGDFRV
jgi:hypothetical protein